MKKNHSDYMNKTDKTLSQKQNKIQFILLFNYIACA